MPDSDAARMRRVKAAGSSALGVVYTCSSAHLLVWRMRHGQTVAAVVPRKTMLQEWEADPADLRYSCGYMPVMGA